MASCNVAEHGAQEQRSHDLQDVRWRGKKVGGYVYARCCCCCCCCVPMFVRPPLWRCDSITLLSSFRHSLCELRGKEESEGLVRFLPWIVSWSWFAPPIRRIVRTLLKLNKITTTPHWQKVYLYLTRERACTVFCTLPMPLVGGAEGFYLPSI